LSIELFIKGLIVGVAIAAPVGPIGLLCIQRALAGGWISGLASGLGAALRRYLLRRYRRLRPQPGQDFLFGHRSTIAVIGGVLPLPAGAAHHPPKPATIAARPRKSAAGLAGISSAPSC
jgi:hypothetical protein